MGLVLLRRDPQHALRSRPEAGQLVQLHLAVERGFANTGTHCIGDVPLELARVRIDDAGRVGIRAIQHRLDLGLRSAIKVDARCSKDLTRQATGR